MDTWLVCKRCEVKEWLHEQTPITPCPTCGSARYAEDGDGHPVILLSGLNDPTDWSPRLVYGNVLLVTEPFYPEDCTVTVTFGTILPN